MYIQKTHHRYFSPGRGELGSVFCCNGLVVTAAAAVVVFAVAAGTKRAPGDGGSSPENESSKRHVNLITHFEGLIFI